MQALMHAELRALVLEPEYVELAERPWCDEWEFYRRAAPDRESWQCAAAALAAADYRYIRRFHQQQSIHRPGRGFVPFYRLADITGCLLHLRKWPCGSSLL